MAIHDQSYTQQKCPCCGQSVAQGFIPKPVIPDGWITHPCAPQPPVDLTPAITWSSTSPSGTWVWDFWDNSQDADYDNL